MKTKELIIKITGYGELDGDIVTASKSPYSILHDANLKKMSFEIVNIGSSEEGFKLTDLSKISEYIEGQDHVNIIIDAHANIMTYIMPDQSKQDHFVITMNKTDAICPGLELIRNISTYTGGKKVNIIFSSCHGAAIHDNIKNLPYFLAEGSKVITLSNAESSTVSTDFWPNKVDPLLEIFKQHSLPFVDLVKLYCLSKRGSENIPVIGVKANDGYYKTISFEEIVLNIINKHNNIEFSPFMKEIFERGILDEKIMLKVISRLKQGTEIEDIKIGLNVGNDALESIKNGNKVEFINQISKNYYSDQLLAKIITFSALEKNYNALFGDSIFGMWINKKNNILKEYPGLDSPEITRESPEIQLVLEVFDELASINNFIKKGKEQIQAIIDKLINNANQNKSLFLFEEGIVSADKDKFDLFFQEEGHILSNHGYLIVLGSDNMDVADNI